MPACYVTNCPNRTNKGLAKQKYFYFPKDENLRAAWLDALNKNGKNFNLDFARICEQHFEDDCFEERMTNPKKGSGRSSRLVRKLKPSSIPTKYLKLKKVQKPQERHPHPSVNRDRYRVATYNELVAYFREKNKETIVSTLQTHDLSNIDNEEQITSDFLSKEGKYVEHVNIKEERHVSSDNLEEMERTINKLMQENGKLLREKSEWLKEKKEIESVLRDKERIIEALEEEKIKAQEKTTEILSKIFTPAQIRKLMSQNNSRVQWELEDITSALALRAQSPKMYRYMRQTLGYPLPCESTIRDWCTTFNVVTE